MKQQYEVSENVRKKHDIGFSSYFFFFAFLKQFFDHHFIWFDLTCLNYVHRKICNSNQIHFIFLSLIIFWVRNQQIFPFQIFLALYCWCCNCRWVWNNNLFVIFSSFHFSLLNKMHHNNYRAPKTFFSLESSIY